MRLSIIIVNYNVKYYLELCLISVIEALKNIESEIIVVDNLSSDGSQQMMEEKFSEVHLIKNSENLGFAKANNQAIKISKGDYILLLNPDTIVAHDTFQKAVNFMDAHTDAGGLGVKMINGEGKFLPESKRGLPNPRTAFYKFSGLSKLFSKSKSYNNYHLGHLDNDKTWEVDVLAGAFFMIRKSVLDKIGLLDEQFFMYGEDIDLSYRITEAGLKNYYFPETRIIHFKGESTKKSTVNYVRMFYKAMLIFANKHFSKKSYKSLFFLINTAIYFSAFLAVLSRFTSFISTNIKCFFFTFLRLKKGKDKRIIVVGTSGEFSRVKEILNHSGMQVQLLENVSISNEIKKHPDYLGCFSQLKDIVKIYKANELIFCINDLDLNLVLNKMEELKSKQIEFKFTATDTYSITGSNALYFS